MWKTGYERTALPRQRQTRRKAGTQSHGPFPNPPGSSAGRQVTERLDGIPEGEERTPERTEIPHQRFSQTSPLDAPSIEVPGLTYVFSPARVTEHETFSSHRGAASWSDYPIICDSLDSSNGDARLLH